ncbi:MAG TPA: D-2-hydroxyacid dehydrogenase [Acidimicrobiia bacterium]
MQILVTETAGRLLDERARGIEPPVEQIRMRRDGGLEVDGRERDASQVHAEVACATGDLFFRGGAAPWFELLLSLESLRWFQSPAAGYLALYDRLFERGVRVTGAHVNAIPIAEYVIQAVLARFQRADEWRAARAAREWRPHEFREVFGTTWLVIGVGSIGSAVAERARALGARVLGHRRHPTGREPVHEMLSREALLDALPRCDVVVLAAPATAETTGFVDDRFIAAMALGSVLVNVARGALVDETALLAALDRGRPEAAILDVFATEPLPADSPFWDHPRVVLTPHSSAGGLARHGRVVDLFVENLERYRDGQPLLHEVGPAAGAQPA